MKKLTLIFLLFLCFSSVVAQNTYTINNETLVLKTEVEGKIDLLWNIIDQEYRYFVRTEDGNIQELVNTKDDNKKFQEEYKSTLHTLTKDANVSVEDLDLTLTSLKQFFKDYDTAVDSDTNYSSDKIKLAARLGFFAGITNQPFIENIENSSVPYFGAELEFFEESTMPRHTGFLSLKHSLESDDFKYTSTQFALGYRFRFINKPKFNVYANAKLVTFTIFDSNIIYEDEDNPGTFLTEDNSGSNIDTPFIFGLGADIKIDQNSFITITYQDIFALFIESQGNFPIDFAIGYKFNL
ncbi:MAG TPA: hypothetical protein VKN14_07245 [Flavobacteriaceae bacterium]|nr:hypothetical protein [Flavobacteriaceae bacterium]